MSVTGDRPPTDRIAGLVERHRANIERAKKLLADRDPMPLIPDVMTPDHPLAKAFGFDQAVAMFDTASRRRDVLAKKRRADVARLSLAGKLVREIAAELGLSYGYVVELRMALGVGRRR
jgi:hypothetical protein